ncbi:MAG TPA: hypothetical protein VNV88_03220 [Candidatus Solibacter sp.]|jgi:hypothetical protein|nr:hypothetical protein [Candidatus Solibacter sp.]
MTWLRKIGFLLMASGLALGQTSAPNTAPADSKSMNELKALREAIAAQQQQLAQQRQKLNELREQVAARQQAASANSSSTAPRLVDATLHSSSSATSTGPVPGAPVQEETTKESPLSFRIGGADFTPGGFIDFENVFRTTNTGNTSATNFGTIPYSNTVAGHLTEFRSTAQYSRLNLKTHAKFGANDVTGYIEADFNGNDPANVFVTANSHTARFRLFWLDLRRGNWEFLGGQTFGLQTPNRTGVSPAPADLALGYQEDSGIGVGYNYTRASAFRAAYHFNDQWVWAAEIQNPQQFVGAGEVIFPFAFNAALGPQFDAANNPGTPNAVPDLLTKIAYDTTSGRHFHIEAGGLLTTAKAMAIPVGGTTFHGTSTVGGGFMGALNFELLKGSEGRNLKFVTNGMWGYGVGRYLNSLAPQAVVRPIQTGPTTFDLATSMVHSGDFVGGFEFVIHPKAQFGLYYGGAYAQRNAFQDVTSPLVIKPFVGFGGPNSPNSANRSVQEVTFDWTQTFWRNPQYGAVLLVTQASYLTRSPWFVAAGAPKNAHLTMSYVSLRYVLP